MVELGVVAGAGAGSFIVTLLQNDTRIVGSSTLSMGEEWYETRFEWGDAPEPWNTL